MKIGTLPKQRQLCSYLTKHTVNEKKEDKEGHYIVKKGLILKDAKLTANPYSFNDREPKDIN